LWNVSAAGVLMTPFRRAAGLVQFNYRPPNNGLHPTANSVALIRKT